MFEGRKVKINILQAAPLNTNNKKEQETESIAPLWRPQPCECLAVPLQVPQNWPHTLKVFTVIFPSQCVSICVQLARWLGPRTHTHKSLTHQKAYHYREINKACFRGGGGLEVVVGVGRIVEQFSNCLGDHFKWGTVSSCFLFTSNMTHRHGGGVGGGAGGGGGAPAWEPSII